MDDLSKFRELTRRYFDGQLAPGESEELQRQLREESAADFGPGSTGLQAHEPILTV